MSGKKFRSGSNGGLDDTDRRILRRLQLDARLHNQDLAAAVGLSPSGLLHRLRRLEKARVIRRYVADIDEAAFEGWVILHGEITLTASGRSKRNDFGKRLVGAPSIIEARRLIGRTDYVLRVAGRDPGVWTTLLEQLDPEGVFIQSASVQVEDAIAKAFSGLPQLND
ncbi:transcriptional regulator of AsnC family [alpha proteobacterium U9-1i]|nr:transcriptional regulator of AsnC family [alpha proteobacterium U9-1i]